MVLILLLLTTREYNSLRKEIWAANDKCVKCGKSGHFAKNCYSTSLRKDNHGSSNEESDEDSYESDEYSDE